MLAKGKGLPWLTVNLNMAIKIKRLTHHPFFPILALILFNLVIGGLTLRDYGESVDELQRRQAATLSLSAYSGNVAVLHSGDEKGPFFSMLAKVGAYLLQFILRGWYPIDYWHLIYFFTFQLGLFSFYMLCLRFASRWTAFSATALFSSQPLLWGHAFMNPKDTPFMAFFIASTAVGLGMVDHFITKPIQLSSKFSNFPNKVWRYHVIHFIHFVWASLHRKELWIAAVILGCTSSIRILGLAAGFIVALYFLSKAHAKAFPIILAYFTIAVIVSYLTWPAMWENPFKGYLHSTFVTTNAEFWNGDILFDGFIFTKENLPHRYLPVLLSIQFTESTLLLTLLGSVVAVYQLIKNKVDRSFTLLMALWFILPISVATITMPTMYNNFRHFLFAIPPLFILAGFGMQTLFNLLKKPAINILLLLLVLAPGLYWDAKLHPYEYVYYNSLVGGVKGAYGRFEMDYWGISFREAGNYLNQIAPNGSKVFTWKPEYLITNYVRKDITVERFNGITKNKPTKKIPTYALVLIRTQEDFNRFPQGKVILQIGREGAVFSILKQLYPTLPASP
jgi:hypothetical protein